MGMLAQKSCTPVKRSDPPVGMDAANKLLTQLTDWTINQEDKTLSKIYQFKNYYETIAFVNAVAWIAHKEDHHPDLQVSYNRCLVIYTTHAIEGLSENDFICAAKIDGLLLE